MQSLPLSAHQKQRMRQKQGLIGQFDLSERQAQAILDMRLQRLTGLERDKIEEEYNALQILITYFARSS